MSSLFNYSMSNARLGSFLELDLIKVGLGYLCYEEEMDAAD